MDFIIQDNLISNEQLQKTLEAVEKYPQIYVGIIPFSEEVSTDGDISGVDHIPYGSTKMTILAKKMGWVGTHFDVNTFNYVEAVKNRNDMLNAEHIMTVDNAIDFLKDCDENKMWFTRPSEDLKKFSGHVGTAEECVTLFENALEQSSSTIQELTGDVLVVLSTPRNIKTEWRWFIVGGKVIDGAIYRMDGLMYDGHEDDGNVISEAQEKADMWLPDDCCVMDLALVDDEVKVIEFNCINSSEFYQHDHKKIFGALAEYYGM